MEEGETACRKIIVTFWREEGDKYQDTLKIEAMKDLEGFMMYLYDSPFDQLKLSWLVEFPHMVWSLMYHALAKQREELLMVAKGKKSSASF